MRKNVGTTEKPLALVKAEEVIAAHALPMKIGLPPVIKTDDDLITVSNWAITCKQELEKLEVERKKITDPLHQAKKATDELFKKGKGPWERSLDICKDMILTWEEKKHQKLLKQAEKRAEKLEASGNEQMAADVLEQAQSQPAIEGVHGLSFQTRKDYKVSDFSMVPDQYKELNLSEVRKAVIAGVKIPGIEVFEVRDAKVSAK